MEELSLNTKLKKILITGTRAPCALEIARHFHFSGHEVISAESLRYPLCRSSRCVKQSIFVPPPRQDQQGYIKALAQIIKNHKIDLLIPTCEEIYTIAKFQDQLKCLCDVFCDDFDKLIRLHDKWRFIEWAKDLSLKTPVTWKLESKQDLETLILSNLPFDIILKPVFSRFALEIHRIYKSNPQLPEIAISKKRPWVAQQLLEGAAFCTYSVVREGRIMAHANYPVKIRAGQGACVYFEHSDQKQIQDWVEEFVDKIKFSGQIAFDFIQDSTGIFYPIECNPRATSGVHLFEPDQCFERVFLPECHQRIIPKLSTKKMVGLAMLFFGVPTLRKFHCLKKWFYSFFMAKDVLFNWKDLGPFFYQFITFFNIWKIAKCTSKSLLEASTHDIEWNGES